MSKLYLGDDLVWENPSDLGHAFIKLRKQIREEEIIQRSEQRQRQIPWLFQKRKHNRRPWVPQAVDSQRELMEKWFGDPISDSGPISFLSARGWSFPAGICTPPVPAHNPSVYEFECVWFLCNEWDYGYHGMPRLRTN